MNTDVAQRIFDAINQHTLPGDGITRPSFSPQETAAMDEVAKCARAYGLVTSYDNVGNLHCALEGTFAVDGEIVTGSHLDSVPHGGRFDGVAGVVAGLLALKQLAESTRTRQGARLIVFRGEESAWFGKCYLGSLGLFGLLTAQDLSRTSAYNGATLRQIITRGWGRGAFVDCDATKGVEPSRHVKKFARFVEVHIEQGPVLHEAGRSIGIVDSIRGNYRYHGAQVHGEPGHSGTTPNRLRKDAVLAFTDLMQRLEHGAKVFGEDLVMTCGVAGTDPNRHAITVIPDVFTFDLEFRSGSEMTLKLFDAFWRGAAAAVQAQRSLPSLELGQHTSTDPAVMDPVVTRSLEQAAKDVGLENVPHLPSGAGHDAAVFAKMGIPTGMIFVRNEHGSHNPKESMKMDDFMIATRVLYRAMGGE